ncbi:MAG: hypothetical protein ICV54_24590 [Nostoc sp. C3-bin3]|nr:hypothetical protein [Nostoc sp. C3-bin3]
MNIVKNIIADLAVSASFWATVNPDFIPVAASVSPIGFTYLLKTSKDNEDNK